MHPSSMKNMQKALDNISIKKFDTVVDIGGRPLEITTEDRTYKTLIECNSYYITEIDPNFAQYDSVVLIKDDYSLPFKDNSVDLVVSGQVFEHIRNPFKMLKEIKRVLKPNAYTIIIAPSEGPDHDWRDCWRFKRDSFKVLAEDTGLELILNYIDNSAKDPRSARWKDHVFIGKKK